MTNFEEASFVCAQNEKCHAIYTSCSSKSTYYLCQTTSYRLLSTSNCFYEKQDTSEPLNLFFFYRKFDEKKIGEGGGEQYFFIMLRESEK